ncbi:SPOR domain-containing protein [Pannonibacter tanglangensis]|uniref:SPOR domain-containing protein n=1 Tax=Pannonibacter tanglangensis TaxID=2750084 RepID=A0ABW9ZCQ1_9HYPH|nr:SPOR domain-containing protein [Pannonibacter sp. XCT-34]NBN62229.1 hypothetical protein [Pannonibacter sp. XCT-34]
MSQRSDYPRSESLRPADPSGRERGDAQGAEDPLVELARIVNRNRQSAPQSSLQSGQPGRVEASDYFAGLEDEDLLKGPGGDPLAPPPLAPPPLASRADPLAARDVGRDPQRDLQRDPMPAYTPVIGGSPNEPAFDFDFDLPKPAPAEAGRPDPRAGVGRSAPAAYDRDEDVAEDSTLAASDPYRYPSGPDPVEPYRAAPQPLAAEPLRATRSQPAAAPAARPGEIDLDFDRFAADLQGGDAGAFQDDTGWEEVDVSDGTTLDADTLDDFDMEPEREPYAYGAKDPAAVPGRTPGQLQDPGRVELRGQDRGIGREPAAPAEPYQPLVRGSARDRFPSDIEDAGTGRLSAGRPAQDRFSEAGSQAGGLSLRPTLDPVEADKGSALEQDLVAGLEDELIGAFQARKEPVLGSVPQDEFRSLSPQRDYETSQRAASQAQPARAAAVPPPPFVPDAAAWPALAPDAKVRSAREASANFAELDDLVGSLFEDERLSRKPEPRRPEPAPSADIDDMAWPDALNALPREEGPADDDFLEDEFSTAFSQKRNKTAELPFNDVLYDDDEAPPPPGGYDLDAVARAMQESDPTLGGAGVLPPHPALETAAAPRQKQSRKSLYIAAAVLGLAGLGGAVFAVTDFGPSSVPSGQPPVVAGLEGPLKTFPSDDQATVESSQPAKLIYDRVGNEERLVVPENPAPAQLPPAPVETAGAEAAPATGPKRVRTLVVRPDGTIISGEAESGSQPGVRVVNTARPDPAAATQPAAAVPGAPAVTDPALLSPSPAQPVPGVPAIVSAGTAPATDPAAAAAAAAAAANAPTVSGLPRPKPGGAGPQVAALQPQAAAPAAVQPQVPAPVPAAPQLAVPQPAAPQPAPAQGAGPLNLTQPQAAQPAQPSAAAPAAAAAVPGGFSVQVTSQRTQEQAQSAYAALQRKFPSVLGGQAPLIEQATLDSRGTFYRVSIPAGSRDQAVSFCESLKAAGGDCFVRRNGT